MIKSVRLKFSYLVNTLFVLSIMLFSTIVYGQEQKFQSPYFDMVLTNNLKLISKSEDKEYSFYRYVFASSNNDDASMQMQVIVSNKKPQSNQTLEDFELEVIGMMSVLFMESHHLYQYLNTPENQKVLNGKPNKIKLGETTFSGATMYFGDIDASFLVTTSNQMTYAFTLISKDSNEQIRKDNLKKLTDQLQSIKFNSPS